MSVDWAIYLTVWAFIAANVASPGPNVLNTITTAMGSGRTAGLWSAWAVGVGVSLWCIGMALGVAALFALVPVAEKLMRLVGAGLLIWFASRYLRAAYHGFHKRPMSLVGVAGLSRRAAFLRSLSVNALNPKALKTWLFVLSIFPVARAGAFDVFLLGLGTAVVATVIHVIYALVFSTPTAARAYLRAAPVINLVVGVFFLTVASKLLLSVIS
jgi:threonine/homoserine/homoserine lactone efflux protein